MGRLAVGAAFLGALLACGGSPPCKGAACPNIAGTYSLGVTQTSSSTCTDISYGGVEGEAVITQDGSALTLTIPGAPLNQNESGTLDVNNTATFGASGSINVFTPDNGELPYTDTNSITLTFKAQPGGTFTIAGAISDSLTATNGATPGSPDANCFLYGTLNGDDN